jgi:hypothetical protein
MWPLILLGHARPSVAVNSWGVGSTNRKRPAGEAGRFWGYYREERYVSLYMCGSVGGR